MKPLTFLRIVTALLIIIHGIARINYEIVDDFGVYLDANGFPFGVVIAWGITCFEIIGGIVLIIGFFIPYISIIFSVQLLMGIIMLHANEGWFVVGAGRNGMEYSVLLICVFLTLAVHYRKIVNENLFKNFKAHK